MNISPDTVWAAADALASGDLQRARDLAQDVLRATPDHGEALTVLVEIARRHAAAGARDDAIAILTDAIVHAPLRGPIHLYLAELLQQAGRFAEAYERFRAADLLKPNNPAILKALARLAGRLGQRAEAAATYGALFGTGAEDDRVWLALSDDAYARAQYAEAAEILEDGIARSGSAALRLRRAMLLPKVVSSISGYVESRLGMAEHLDALIDSGARIANLAQSVNQTPYLLPYAGLNNRALQMNTAAAHLAVAPDLAWTAPHCARPRVARARIRIGFVSQYLTLHHTIRRLYIVMIQRLDRARFEVFVIAPAASGEAANTMRAAADHTIALPERLEDARDAMAALELDLLIYPDIGMNAQTYYLAFARLAPKQAVFFGHPMTTGIPTIDTFISSALKEPADYRDHYSEPVTLLPRMPFFFPRPSMQDALPLDGLNLPAGATLYACPQTIIKFHPDFDHALAGILAADPRGKLVLIKTGDDAWYELLFARLRRIIPDIVARLIALPPIPVGQYLGLLARADAVLDPFPFCGGNSSYEAFAAGAPLVTLPGKTMCGRLTDAFYRQMGLPEMVSHTVPAYVERAVRLANDRSFRADQAAAIAARDHEIFEDRKALALLEETFAHMVAN